MDWPLTSNSLTLLVSSARMRQALPEAASICLGKARSDSVAVSKNEGQLRMCWLMPLERSSTLTRRLARWARGLCCVLSSCSPSQAASFPTGLTTSLSRNRADRSRPPNFYQKRTTERELHIKNYQDTRTYEECK